MTLTPRQAAVRALAAKAPTGARFPLPEESITETYGAFVFNDAAQRKHLPRDTYKRLRRTINLGEALDPSIAGTVANAMKDWAVSHGATHYSHWFQPMTGSTAEKQDSFITPTGTGSAILEFSGKELTQGEPDASSLPSGGIRVTFEARGYTAWDPLSPAFLRHSPNGVTLTIPTAFCSWTGEALDTKTPLLRSNAALDTQARRVLDLLQKPGEPQVGRVFTNVGAEQEFFLIDRELFYLRPDLMACGRTLFGAPPPKGQEQDDHYFASMPGRVMAFMQDLERRLWRLGIPIKTRHNEVAPSQYEMAPIFESVTVACDHNMLVMDLLHEVARGHGMKCLLHEKPYSGLNGSGKHNNYSVGTDLGHNLLDPGKEPHENQRFMVFLTALIAAVDKHQDLLRSTVASVGNDHRLGANEAPPAIMSIFMGSDLQGVIESIIAGEAHAGLKGEKLHLGVSSLPNLPRDTTDRNRTSPFAFTGNKFEFRAPGSSQSLAYPNYVLNTILAESLEDIAESIEALPEGGRDENAVQAILRTMLTEHERILFPGDNYAAAWTVEAERRGLLNLHDTPSALAELNAPKNLALFEKYGVLSEREWLSRTAIVSEAYQEKLRVEARVAVDMAATMFLPAGLRAQHKTADSLNAARTACQSLDLDVQIIHLTKIAKLISDLQANIDNLRDRIANPAVDDDEVVCARKSATNLIPAMSQLREVIDELETLVPDDLWPVPKYRELLTVH
jgi:glutamine synthetase